MTVRQGTFGAGPAAPIPLTFGNMADDSKETAVVLREGLIEELADGPAGAVVGALLAGLLLIVVRSGRAIRRAVRKRRSLLDGGPGIT